jgi:Ras-related protein Rab-23
MQCLAYAKVRFDSPLLDLMLLLDAAGQDEFDSIVRNYFKGAGAAVLTFSTTDRESFDAIKKWKSRLEAECGDIAIVLVQNKVSSTVQAQYCPGVILKCCM